MTNKQKIKELQNKINKIEKDYQVIKEFMVTNADFSSIIQEAKKKCVGGLSKEQVQELIYQFTLIAYTVDNRKGNLSLFTAKLIEIIADKASVQNEQTESEETKNECDI